MTRPTIPHGTMTDLRKAMKRYTSSRTNDAYWNLMKEADKADDQLTAARAYIRDLERDRAGDPATSLTDSREAWEAVKGE